MFEALRRWDDKHKHTKKIEELKKRALLAQVQNAAAAETKAKSESTSFESLSRRVQDLERHILTTEDTTTTPLENPGMGVAKIEQGKLLVEPPVVVHHAGVGNPGNPNSRPESSMQRRRRVAAEEAAALKAAATAAATAASTTIADHEKEK